MEGTEEVILRIKAENSEALNAITRQKAVLDELRSSTKSLQQENKDLGKSMKELAKAGKENTDEYASLQKQVQANNTTIAANSEAVKAANKVISDNSREIQNNMKISRENTDSIQAMRAQLSRMRDEYYSLSKAQRENESIGGALQKSIKDLNDEISDAEQSIGVFGRNVGNYEQSIKNAIGANNSFIQQIQAMQDQANATGQSFGKVLVNGVKDFGAAIKSLLANPMVLVLTGVAAILYKLVQAFKSNEEASRKMQTAFSSLKVVINVLEKAVQAIVNVIASIVEWLDKVSLKFSRALEKIPLIGGAIKSVNDAVQRQIDLEKEKQALQDANRENSLKQAQTDAEIEKLKNDIDNKHNKTTKERIAAADEALRKAKEQGDENIRLAKEELRIAQEVANQDKALSAEEKDRIQELKNAVFQAEQAKYARINELSNMRKGVIDEEAAAEQEALKARQEAWKAYQDTVAAGTERIYELTLDLMQEGLDKEKAIRKKQYEEDLAGIEGTEEQKQKIRLMLAEQYERDISKLEEKYSQEELDRRIAAEEANMNRLIEINRGNYSRLQELRLQQLESEKAQAIEQAQETGESVELIEIEYEQKKQDAITELREQAEADRQAKLQEYLDSGLEGTDEDSELEKLETELELRQQYYDSLVNMDAEAKAQMFTSEEQWRKACIEARNAVIKSDRAVMEEKDRLAKLTKRQAMTQVAAVGEIAGQISTLLGEVAGDNEQAVAFQKVATIAQIAINTALGIANAVAQGAAAGPPPANLVAIATGVAAVVSGIVAAKQALSQAQDVKAPAFATGGLVTGPGTGTSDDIPAMLSNGESVITAKATDMFAPLLSTLNQAGGGVPIAMNDTAAIMDGRDYMTEMLEQSLSAMPSPVVSVEEINTVQSRVTVLERMRNAG